MCVSIDSCICEQVLHHRRSFPATWKRDTRSARDNDLEALILQQSEVSLRAGLQGMQMTLESAIAHWKLDCNTHLLQAVPAAPCVKYSRSIHAVPTR